MEGLTLPGTEDLNGTLCRLPNVRGQGGNLEEYMPLANRLRIIKAADEEEEKSVLAAADYRFIQGSQWHKIIEDRQWKEEGYDSQKEWFKLQSKKETTAREYAEFYLFCKECDQQSVDRPTSTTQVKAFRGHGSLEDRVKLWEELTESDDPLGGTKLRKQIESRHRVPDDEPETPQLEVDYTRPEPEQDAPQVDTEALQGRIEALEKQARKAAEKAKKAEEAKKRAQDKAAKEAKKVEESKQAEYLELLSKERQEIHEDLERQLADVYARYGIEQSPDIFEVNEEHFRAAVGDVRSQREEDALKVLMDVVRLFRKLQGYEPEEAARAFLNRPSSPERSKEVILETTDWLNRCVKEMDSLTTKGVLRAVKGE